MTTFTVRLMDPDGFQRLIKIEAQTAGDAAAEARKCGLITHHDYVESVREEHPGQTALEVAS